jgi:hypothetical protein
MPRTSKGHPSLGPESDTSQEHKFDPYWTAHSCLTSDFSLSWLTRLQPEIQRCLDSGGNVAILRQGGLTYVNLHLPRPTKAAP